MEDNSKKLQESYSDIVEKWDDGRIEYGKDFMRKLYKGLGEREKKEVEKYWALLNFHMNIITLY